MKLGKFTLKIKDMKKLFFLVVLLVVGLMFIVSCKEGPLDPPAQKFTITASVVNGIGGKIICPNEAVSGAVVEILTEADPGYTQKTITVNGVATPMTSKNYVISTNASTNYEVKVTFEKTLSWIFLQGSWVKDSVYIYEPKTPEDPTLVWKYYSIPRAEADVVTFLPNGRFDVMVGSFKGDGPWSVDETTKPPTLNWGGAWKVENISSESFRIFKDNFKDVYKKVK